MNTPDETPLDERLRAAYDFMAAPAEVVPPPAPQVWAGIEAGLRAPVAPPLTRAAVWRAGVGGVVLGALLAVLLGWWWPTGRSAEHKSADSSIEAKLPVATRRPPVTTRPLPIATRPLPAATRSLPVTARPHPVTARPMVVAPAAVAAPVAAPVAPVGGAAAVLPPAAPGVLLPIVPGVLQPLVTTEITLAGWPATDTSGATRENRRATLLAQRAALRRLQVRTDSLLLALNDAAFAPPPPAVDSSAPKPLRRRWSVALAFAPERNFFGLNAPAADTLAALRRTHEQGRGGFNAAFLAEYRLTDRWSVAGGAGLSTYGAELRLTDRRTLISTHLDSTETVVVSLNYDTTRAYSVRVVRDTALSPVFNLNGQIIRYQQVLIPRNDTVWTVNTVANYDTTRTRTYTPTITRREEVSARILRPNYRFLTLPVLVCYRLGNPDAPGARWWTDVALGAQVQFFLGGMQLRTTDGRTFVTERIGPRGGPFRAVNVALQGSLAVNYALTPRLSASVAPTLRWQAQSVYKPETGLSQRPTATGLQVGLRWAW